MVVWRLLLFSLMESLRLRVGVESRQPRCWVSLTNSKLQGAEGDWPVHTSAADSPARSLGGPRPVLPQMKVGRLMPETAGWPVFTLPVGKWLPPTTQLARLPATASREGENAAQPRVTRPQLCLLLLLARSPNDFLHHGPPNVRGPDGLGIPVASASGPVESLCKILPKAFNV
jgi:hypothetical protein